MVGGAIPKQVVLGCIRKKLSEPWRASQEAAWPLLQFLL